MKCISKVLGGLLIYSILGIAVANTTANQTDDLSPVLPNSSLPFHIVIEQAGFQLPVGLHSGAFGVFQGQWIFIAGRLNGLHGFNADPFRPQDQNTTIYVVNPTTGSVSSRSLFDPSSGLTNQQIDALSVTSPEMYQDGTTLYIVGGYGVDRDTSGFSTKSVITAVNLPGILQWVTNPAAGTSVAANISQVFNSQFQISGGRLNKIGNMMQLVFGQNFGDDYNTASNGEYSQQVRQFQTKSVNGQLSVNIYNPMPATPNANFRRRDLNVAPIVLNKNNVLSYGLIAYSGVFTTAGGVWTVPVVIDGINDPVMADPNSASSFKQGLNNYASAIVGLYSRTNVNMYHIIFGGLTYGFYTNGVFNTDAEIPFTNQITTIQMDKNGNFTQYLMDAQYPTIVAATGVNAGNTLLFGAGAYFIPSNISAYPNSVLNLDNIRSPTVIGYIVGGIASALPNTNTMADSIASPYIFKVTLVPS